MTFANSYAKRAMLFLMGGVSLGLTGCAALAPNSSMMSSPSDSATLQNTSVPSNAHARFESRNPIYDRLSDGDAAINHAYFKTRKALQAPKNSEDAAGRFAPHINPAPKGRASQAVSSARVAPVAVTQNYADDGITFVKSDGTVDVADWDHCAQTSGAVFDETQTGFELSQPFSRCMTDKGYKPEAELLAELDAAPTTQALLNVNSIARETAVSNLSTGTRPSAPLSIDTRPATLPQLRSFSRSTPKVMPVEKLMQDEALAGGL